MAKTKKKRTVPTLTPDQIRHLRGLGHHLKPLAMLGREGITDNLIKAVEEVLNAHELIKVKIQENFPDDRHVGAEAVARACSAALAQVLGRTFLIYRPNPDLPTERRI
ncbi:MAG: ribosome assembly RNA-binding protein YhbY, partial [Desulfobulbaceae bacterium]|nr:ribosome assembly RNA-binding protein YhbY [Desulfobulbaceae bacterium]